MWVRTGVWLANKNKEAKQAIPIAKAWPSNQHLRMKKMKLGVGEGILEP